MFRKVLPLIALLFIACGSGGDQFENYCVDVDCGGNGQCVVGADGPICICDDGFIVQDGVCKESQVADPCEGITCGGHGACIITASNEAFCACDQGYHRDGTNCVATLGPCSDLDCGDNASCLVTPSNEPFCSCNEGYHREGDDCVLTTNACLGFDCGEHGRCALGAEGAMCICDPGFILQDEACTEVPEEDNPCEDIECAGNGVCAIAHDNTVVCHCRPGYHSDGAQCLEDTVKESPCKGITCGDYGSCVAAGDNTPLCVCDEGYHREGNNCVATPNPCAEVNCGVGGRCALGADGHICICDPGYTVQNDVCQESPTSNPCQDVVCAGNGVCAVAHDNTAVCHCRPGYHSDGDKCVEDQTGTSACTGITCSNNGSCVVTGDDKAICVCDEGFSRYGNNCVKFGGCQASSVCSNGYCLILPCSFVMGSPDDEACREAASEGPLHVVTISRSFYMKQTEVTQKEWRDVVNNNPSGFSSCGDDCPVEKVSWFDAVYYANKLSEKENLETCYVLTNQTGTAGTGNYSATVTFKGLNCKGYRLPTEAEWEYATRAGTTTAFWIGDNIGTDGTEVCGSADPKGTGLPEIAWYAHNAGGKTHKVKGKLPNPWGLYDVSGNVWEWVNDLYAADFYGSCLENCIDPLGPESGDNRVNRGGGFSTNAGRVRSAIRIKNPPSHRADNVGFRLARSLP